MSEGDRIESVGIIGAGARGREIAVCALLNGYRVVLEDISSARLAEGAAHIAAALASAVVQQRIDPARRREIAAKFSSTQSIDEVSRTSDFLIEAAPEDAELQLEVFTVFDRFARPGAILASTAHSLSVTDLAEMTNCPERCVGFRFPEPGSSGALQIIRAPRTSDRTVQACANFARTLGLTPAIVSEAAVAREVHIP